MALSLDEGGLSWMRPVKEPRERGTVMAPPAAPAGDESVWRPGSGFRNTGAFRERAMQGAQMAARGAEMGEPTSYRGGVGAPEPIAVMRGGATTFSPGRLPGRQFVEPEMATPTQAQQAWNRGMRGQTIAEGERRRFTVPEGTLDTRFGGLRAPGQTLKEAAPGEPPSHGELYRKQGLLVDEQMAALKRENAAKLRAETGANFDKYYKSMFGGSIPKENEAAHADYADARAWEQDRPGEGKKRYGENIQIRQFEPLFTQQNLDTHKLGFSMEELGQLKQQDPELYRRTVLMFGPKLTGAGATAPSKSWWGLPTQRQGPLQPAFQLPEPATETVPPM